ncbi:MAG: VanZ family protein [Lachnospiraceae bacterium]|nr:VanZ family protein [Lachnospiraceae bacterium]
MTNKKRKHIRIWGKFLFVIYLVFLVYFLIFSDWYGRSGVPIGLKYNIVPFNEIKRYWNLAKAGQLYLFIKNVAGNILIFVPFGIFVTMGSKYRNFFKTTFLGIGFSLIIEIFQLITEVGCFDVDDIILNTIGVILGFIIYEVFHEVKIKKKTR